MDIGTDNLPKESRKRKRTKGHRSKRDRRVMWCQKEGGEVETKGRQHGEEEERDRIDDADRNKGGPKQLREEWNFLGVAKLGDDYKPKGIKMKTTKAVKGTSLTYNIRDYFSQRGPEEIRGKVTEKMEIDGATEPVNQ